MGLEQGPVEAWRQLQLTIDRIVPMALEHGLAGLSPAERVVLLVWTYSFSVDNGGHASFFYNSYGEFAHETVVALEDVGASAYARILGRAIQQFPDGKVPQGLDARNDALNALPDDCNEVFERLDADYYLQGSDELMERLLVYSRAS